jgi:hypothetical protein
MSECTGLLVLCVACCPARPPEREPSLERGGEPSPEKEREPSLEKEREPSPEKEREPSFEKEREPSFEKEREPSFEKEGEPSPEKEREPSLEKEREPSPEKEREPSPEKEREPSPEKEGGAVSQAPSPWHGLQGLGTVYPKRSTGVSILSDLSHAGTPTELALLGYPSAISGLCWACNCSQSQLFWACCWAAAAGFHRNRSTFKYHIRVTEGLGSIAGFHRNRSPYTR